MRPFKKILALLLTGAMLLPQMSVFAEDVEEAPKAEAVIVEAEKAETVEGAFKAITGAGHSGGGSMQVFVTKDTPSSFTVDFDVEVEGEYDVWLLGSLGSTDYVSQYEYQISDEDWKKYSGISGGSGGYRVVCTAFRLTG